MRGLAGCVVFLAAISTEAFAQRDTTAFLRGQVTDSASQPVEGVEIAATTVGRMARSDAEGRFSLGGLVAGRNRILVRRLGWRAVDTTVTIASGQPLELRLTLVRVSQALEAVHINVQDECPSRTLEGFECRRRAGIGAFRDSAEIAALYPFCQSDLLVGMEGLRRIPGVPCALVESTKGWRCIRTLVDGSPASRPPLRLTDYIGVEFYEDYEKVPEWYKQLAYASSQRSDRAAPSPSNLNTRGGGRGIGRSLPPPTMPGHTCAFVVYWTHFAQRFNPMLDQNASVTRAMRPRRDSMISAILDSTRAKTDSTARKKP